MHGIRQQQFRALVRQRRQGVANLLEALAEIFASMSGDEHDRPIAPLRAEQLAKFLVELNSNLRGLLPAPLNQQGVNNSIARHQDSIAGYSLREQRLPSGLRRTSAWLSPKGCAGTPYAGWAA